MTDRPLHEYIDLEAYDVVPGPQYRKLVEQLEAAHDALCAAWWTGVHGELEEILRKAVTPEMRVEYARRHAGSNPASPPSSASPPVEAVSPAGGGGESSPASSPKGNELWAAWNRCPICEGVDQPGLIHQPDAPYCSQAQNTERKPS